MKVVALLLFLSLTVACSQSEESPDLEESGNQEEVISQQALGTDEILFTATILNVYENEKDVCGLSKINVSTIEVMEVIQYGSSVQQRISKEQQLDVVFLIGEPFINIGSTIEAKARETLCESAASTYFTVIAHKILD